MRFEVWKPVSSPKSYVIFSTEFNKIFSFPMIGRWNQYKIQTYTRWVQRPSCQSWAYLAPSAMAWDRYVALSGFWYPLRTNTTSSSRRCSGFRFRLGGDAFPALSWRPLSSVALLSVFFSLALRLSSSSRCFLRSSSLPPLLESFEVLGLQ